MAIVFKNKKYNLEVDSNLLIGVMGSYESFFSSLVGDNVYYINKKYDDSNKRVCSLLNKDLENVKKILKELEIGEAIVDKKINELSHSEQKLLKYVLMVLSNKKIVIIDEPFMDLDFAGKKKITLLINSLLRKKKTIIVGSVDSNIIYGLCKKVLFISDNKYYYDDIMAFTNKKVLKEFHIDMPYLVRFVELAKNKKIRLNYSRDIRDLMKDVYRNVSQK